ncbi:3-phenylpropionate/trans-cinnamate dioxygenase ferredoxin reductase subunit [Filomicrobium insigne]|uniref:3-phenylpropionate/trans-cinnamate dioxygenase ferredoxin reductase subunit n=1 Tax=Filomicrobium insigne TaxID=418854 RepID=A0A1H0G677_9HYPH|nr:FAD-dependent oxidoreductase [Filomicrobium insigne]SDO02360.1 3-phenylpropionate/trans-cinnamate dioxygenase ferredoxin reductase subunit [Filomicrobium insigne]
MSLPIVIVGAGQAAARAIETLHGLSCGRRIVLVGSEPHLPYQRPPLSKKFLTGDATEEQLWLQGEAFLEKADVDFRRGETALELDVTARNVTLSGGETLAYHQLLIATGSQPRRLNLAGEELAGVHTLYSIADVQRLGAGLEDAQRVVIIGGGYIGLEVAASLIKLGKDVTVLEQQDRLLSRVVSPVLSDFFKQLHEGHGVTLRFNARAQRIEGDTDATGVMLDDGSVISADLVLVAAGAVANDQIAREAGLACDNGIFVDEACRVAPHVFAAGDCTRFPSRRYGRHLRLESVQNANDQARAAATAMCGDEVRYDPVPWFWSDQYDVKLQIAGLSDGYDRVSVEGDPKANSFAVSYWRGPQLLAVDAINTPRAFMQARRTLQQPPSQSTPSMAASG